MQRSLLIGATIPNTKLNMGSGCDVTPEKDKSIMNGC